MATLDQMLQEEYHQENPSIECREAVKDYLQSVKIEELEACYYSLIKIKKITKITRNILQSEPEYFDGLLEKLYSYHLFGFNIKKKSSERDANSKTEANSEREANITKIKAHILADAGEIAKLLFYKTGKAHWAEKWFDHKNDAAEIGKIVDPANSMIYHNCAAEAAKALSDLADIAGNIEQKLQWLENKFDSHILSAEVGEKEGFPQTAYAYRWASKTAERYFEAMPKNIKPANIQTKWLKRVYIYGLKAIQLNKENNNPLFFFYASNHIAIAACLLYQKTKHYVWRKRATIHYRKVCSIPVEETEKILDAKNYARDYLRKLKK